MGSAGGISSDGIGVLWCLELEKHKLMEIVLM